MTTVDDTSLIQRLAELEERVSAAELAATRAGDRGAVENVFNRYMHYHNAYEDERIISELWAKPGTEGIRSRYNNVGEYSTYESVTAYHRGRPRPVGKLLFHYTTTPVVEVSADGTTAKGIWIMAGLESGLMDPEIAKEAPDYVFSGGEVDGKPVFLPPVDGPIVTTTYTPYANDTAQTLDPEPPRPYDEFEDTFR
jgi:hypothetical protein